jgi:copper chaperone CopZ
MKCAWVIGLAVVGLAGCQSQVQNARIAHVRVNGNCGMCEETIEASIEDPALVRVDWNKATRMAVIAYDTARISLSDVLRRIADAGYDNEQQLAPDEVYERLPHCCRYTRTGRDISPPSPSGSRTDH